MKNIISVVIILITIVFISCDKDISKPGEANGKLHIDIGPVINIHEYDGTLKSIPSINDFKVVIYNADGSELMAYESFQSMPDSIDLGVGEYYIEAFSDNNIPADFDNPYYYGISEIFMISSNLHTTIEVTCKLSNTIVSVVYSENIVSEFSNYSTTVLTEHGFLVYGETENRKGYFQTYPIDISVELAFIKPDGTTINRNLNGSIPTPLPNRHYQISVDASISEGMTSFMIIQDTSEVITEVIVISDDQGVSQDGKVNSGDLIISEIMMDPSALSDTEGEFFEIYNNSSEPINLKNLILSRDDTNMHTIDDSILLDPGAFYVLCKTEGSVGASNKYIYGSAITLSNTGAVLSISNEEVNGVPGEVIFSINYGSTGFPSGAGVSIILNPQLMNYADAVVGTSWCKSTSTYSTGDLGTPGLANDACQ